MLARIKMALIAAGMVATTLSAGSLGGVPPAAAAPIDGIHNIQHVVVIMQENRSFDHYYGTYPGANGIPGGVCVPDPLNGGCVAPFHDPNDLNYGGPHGAPDYVADFNGGQMNGFVGRAERGANCLGNNPTCSPCNAQSTGQCIDAMGYHDAREVPNYWTYAQNYALQDAMYEPNSSWSWPEHLFQLSGWSAACTNYMVVNSCTSNIDGPPNPGNAPNPYRPGGISLPWTDVTYLLHKHAVSWGYYVFTGTEPDCEIDSATSCAGVLQNYHTPGIWNPLPDFQDVRDNAQVGNVQSLSNFYSAVSNPSSCALPNVSWIDPSGQVSEHPTGLVSAGQAYVTTLVNSVMSSPCWSNTAIFVSWDDWGGFYDHVVPPQVDQSGYGFRVPGLVISPYSRAGYIDHQTLSHDAYLKFIEDDFLGGQRLDPATDGRPDPRPTVRENVGQLGNLLNDFDFTQSPRPPLILPTHPAPGPASNPPGYVPPGTTPPGTTPPGATSPGPPPAGTSPAGASAAFQLTASVARREHLHLHHDRLTFVLGCNVACSILAHGHLSLVRGGHHLALHGEHVSLASHRSEHVSLRMSHNSLMAVLDALRGHHHVSATIEVSASVAGATSATPGATQRYSTHMSLST